MKYFLFRAHKQTHTHIYVDIMQTYGTAFAYSLECSYKLTSMIYCLLKHARICFSFGMENAPKMSIKRKTPMHVYTVYIVHTLVC